MPDGRKLGHQLSIYVSTRASSNHKLANTHHHVVSYLLDTETISKNTRLHEKQVSTAAFLFLTSNKLKQTAMKSNKLIQLTRFKFKLAVNLNSSCDALAQAYAHTLARLELATASLPR